jgi:hypothetical protein
MKQEGFTGALTELLLWMGVHSAEGLHIPVSPPL